MNSIHFLNQKADFEIYIAKGIKWIPIVQLGISGYTNSEIAEMVCLTPEEKKEQMKTLYDVIQLFLISDFNYKLDMQYKNFDGRIWEFHKPSRKVISTNCGCCASVASWINYFIKEMFEETGYFSFIRPNGSGHIMNYFYHSGFYYLLDLTPYAMKLYPNFKENGNKVEWIKSHNITGILCKCESLIDYAKFYDRIQNYGGVSFMYFKEKEVAPLAIDECKNKIYIVFPLGYDISFVYGKSDYIDYKFSKAHDYLLTWEG